MGYDISDPTLVDLTSNFFFLCTNMKVKYMIIHSGMNIYGTLHLSVICDCEITWSYFISFNCVNSVHESLWKVKKALTLII